MASSSAAVSVETNITASPIVLMNRTGGAAMSWARSASRLASCSSCSGGSSSPSAVNPTRSANAAADGAGAGQRRPRGALAGVDRLGLQPLAQLQQQQILDHRTQQRRRDRHQGLGTPGRSRVR